MRKELQDLLAALGAQGRSVAKEHDALAAKENRSAEDDAELARLAGEVERITTEINEANAKLADLEARENRDRLFASTALTAPAPAPVPTPSAVTPLAPVGQVLQPAALGAARVNSPNPELMGGFSDVSEFADMVRTAYMGGGVDERLTAAATAGDTHTTGGQSGEGYLVPPAMRQEIWEVVFADDGLLARFDPEPTNSNTVSGGADESTPWGNSGIQAGWAGELSKMDLSKLSTEGRDVKLEKLYCFVAASDELLEDAPLLGNRLTRKAGEAIRWAAVDAFITGNGVGKPLGFANAKSKALVTASKVDGQAAGTIVAENILQMISQSVLGPRSFFMCGQDALPKLGTMTIGDNVVHTPPTRDDFARGIGGFLNGIPLVYSQHAEKLGVAGDIRLINPAGYASFSKRQQIQFASSIHLFFDQGAQAFRWTFRLGGKPHLSKPISSAKDKPSLSHFVQLEAR